MTLYAVIILGATALALVVNLTLNSVWNIRSAIDSKNSNQMKALSNACVEIALEMIRENNNYIGTTNVNIDGNLCTYTVINNGGDNRTVSASGAINNITRKIEVLTNAFNPLNVVSWQEVP